MSKDVKDLIRYKELARYRDIIPGFIHNINSPLMGISGRMELIKFKNPDIQGIDQVLEQLDKINEMLNTIGYMVENDKATDEAKIDITQFFAKLDRFLNFNMTYKHKIRMETEIPESLSLVTVPFIFLSIFYEIFSNCITAMEEGGVIKLKTQREGYNITTTISRTGNRIPDDLLEAVNSESVQELPEDKLLDLLVAKKLAEAVEGKVTVMNCPDGVEYTVVTPG